MSTEPSIREAGWIRRGGTNSFDLYRKITVFHTLNYSEASLEHHLAVPVADFFFRRQTEAGSAFANAPVISQALTVPSHFGVSVPGIETKWVIFFFFFPPPKQRPDHESPESHFCLIITQKMGIFSVPSMTWHHGAGWEVGTEPQLW